MASFGQMFSQLGQMYSNLSMGKKISFLLFLAIGIGAFSILVMVAKQPDYRVLYSDLAAEDMNEIVTFLKDNRIKYTLSSGGSAVSVATADFYDIRMQLAGAGLPNGGSTGFEIFDGKSLGMTDFQQAINFQRALQGELARSVQQLAAVESCRVHLVMPKATLFEKDQNETTASVALKLRKNGRLNQEQIESIVFLVSGSVEGLDPSNVTVIDAKGKILSKRREDDVAGPVNSAMLDYKSKIEIDMEQRIISLLAKSVGADKVAAKVSADIDFRQVSKTEERYDPESQVARSEKVQDETSDSSETSTANSPGIDTNIPDQTAAADGSNNEAKSAKRTETINYEISRVVSQINEPVGEIKTLSIAVMIDGTYQIVDEQRNYIERSSEEMEKFSQLVKKAVGFTPERGDQLEVLNIPFQADDAFESQTVFNDPKRELIFTIVNNSLLGLGLIVFALVVLRPLIRWLTAEPAYESVAELAGMLPSGIAELEQRMLGAGAQDALSAGEAGSAENKGNDLKKSREQIIANAHQDKKAIAAIMKKWLKEQEH